MARKKLAALIFAVTLSVALNGCGNPSAPTNDQAKIEETASSMNQASAKPGQPSEEKQGTNAVQTKAEQEPAAETGERPPVSNLIQAKVIQPIDGDTIKVSINQKEETIRFLLVDTPETKHPKYGAQPFGKEASNFTKSLVEGKTVELEQDVNNGPDKYGRLLYYVYVDGKSVQEQLLEKGLARVAYIYVPNVKYVDKYREIQAKAQKAGVGIWSVENYAQEDGYHPDMMKNSAHGSTQAVSKPVQSQKKTPDQIKQEVHKEYASYKNCTEARAAGAAPLKKGEPGYSEKLDRDKDGIACE